MSVCGRRNFDIAARFFDLSLGSTTASRDAIATDNGAGASRAAPLRSRQGSVARSHDHPGRERRPERRLHQAAQTPVRSISPQDPLTVNPCVRLRRSGWNSYTRFTRFHDEIRRVQAEAGTPMERARSESLRSSSVGPGSACEARYRPRAGHQSGGARGGDVEVVRATQVRVNLGGQVNVGS